MSKKIILFSILIISILFLISCKGEEASNASESFQETVSGGNSAKKNEYDKNEFAETDLADNKNEVSATDRLEVHPSDAVTENTEETNALDEYHQMEVHFIDVGEADSALIICGDEAMLVDTGTPDKGTAIRLYMKQHNVSKLKYLLLTHSDKDHIGGAASVISNVDIDNLFMCRYEKDNDVYMSMINEIDYKSMSWTTPEVGSEYELGDAVITIIAPNSEYDNPNDSSIAFVIRHGDNSFIFTGDAEETAEADIVNNGLDISADVYYVGHHGSYTSSTQAFLDKVNPKYAVISCAKDNEYGHPHIETMEKLNALGVSLFRTDDQGIIIAYSNGNEISFNVLPSDNWTNGNAPNAESASTQVKNAIAEASAAAENEQTEVSEEITYVLNKNSMKFHKIGCDSVKDMAKKNREDVTLGRDEIIELGFTPCKRCNP